LQLVLASLLIFEEDTRGQSATKFGGIYIANQT